MRRQFLLLIFLGILAHTISAQVEFNRKGVFGFGYGKDPNGPYPIVQSISLGSPAFNAGLVEGDKILSVNGQSLAALPLETIAQKLDFPMGVSATLSIEHADKTVEDVVLKKAGFIDAKYQIYTYRIFFDENGLTLYTNPDERCVWTDNNCYNGFGYYIYDTHNAFFGEFENGMCKSGLRYFVHDGKPHYYLGEYINGTECGEGTRTYFDVKVQEERKFVGTFSNGVGNGFGQTFGADNKPVHTGFYRDGFYEGYGIGWDGGEYKEGFWRHGIYWRPWPEGVPYFDPIQEPELYDEILQEEIALDAQELEVLKQKMEKYFEDVDRGIQLKAAQRQNQPTSGETSLLDMEAERWTQKMIALGLYSVESFDVTFDRYTIGSCFTTCSDYGRRLFVLVESGVNCIVSDVDVAYVLQKDDINGIEKHPIPFEIISNENGVVVHNANVTVPMINSGCSFQWQVRSDDVNVHRAKVLVFN